MGSAVLDLTALLQVPLKISQELLPTAVADIVALAILASVVTTYLLRGLVWDRPDACQYVYFERPQQQKGSGNLSIQATRDIAKKLEETGK